MSPEKRFENRVIAAFEARGWFARHFDAPGLDGWPDILALKGPKYLLIEVKSGTSVSIEQKAFFHIFEKTYDKMVFMLAEQKDGSCTVGSLTETAIFYSTEKHTIVEAVDWLIQHG